MKARVLISLDIDEEDYPVPVDGSVEEEINEAIYVSIYRQSVFLKNGIVSLRPPEWDGKKRGPKSPFFIITFYFFYKNLFTFSNAS